MPTFEVDIRGEEASNARERLVEAGIEAELLPHGIVIGSFEADSTADAERRIDSILGGDSGHASVRRAGGRPARERKEPGGSNPGAHPFDNEVHPADPEAEEDGR